LPLLLLLNVTALLLATARTVTSISRSRAMRKRITRLYISFAPSKSSAPPRRCITTARCTLMAANSSWSSSCATSSSLRSSASMISSLQILLASSKRAMASSRSAHARLKQSS